MSYEINHQEEEGNLERDFREPTREKRTPKAVADGIQGKILAVADISGTPEQVFHAVTSNEVEKWWKMPGSYRRKEWKADVKVGGQWSFAVETNEGKQEGGKNDEHARLSSHYNSTHPYQRLESS